MKLPHNSVLLSNLNKTYNLRLFSKFVNNFGGKK